MRKKKLRQLRNKELMLVAVGAVLVCILGSVAYGQFGQIASSAFLKANPDIAKIYKVEQSYFPDYTVSVFKRVTIVNGQKDAKAKYSVILSSHSMPDQYELIAAGRLACQTGLAPSTIVSVTGRRQYWPFPFYHGETKNGVCP